MSLYHEPHQSWTELPWDFEEFMFIDTLSLKPTTQNNQHSVLGFTIMYIITFNIKLTVTDSLNQQNEKNKVLCSIPAKAWGYNFLVEMYITAAQCQRWTKDFADHDKIISLWQVYTGVNPQQCPLPAFINEENRAGKVINESTDAIIHFIL